RPRLKAGVTDHFLAGGATYGLNAPPGNAEATALSKPSLLTEETPKTQSSTRMWGRLTQLRHVPPFCGTHSSPAGEETSHWLESVLRYRTTYRVAPGTGIQLIMVSVLTAPSTFGAGGGGALAMLASAATLSLVILAR